MAKVSELRDMSDEQIQLTWKEASENLFRLRIKCRPSGWIRRAS